MKFKVTDPDGVLIGGKRYRQGQTLPQTAATTAQVRAFLRFKQIEKVEEKPEPDPDLPKAPSTVDELKAALTKRGVKFPEDAKKADLEKLFAGATASAD